MTLRYAKPVEYEGEAPCVNLPDPDPGVDLALENRNPGPVSSPVKATPLN